VQGRREVVLITEASWAEIFEDGTTLTIVISNCNENGIHALQHDYFPQDGALFVLAEDLNKLTLARMGPSGVALPAVSLLEWLQLAVRHVVARNFGSFSKPVFVSLI
jgi:hypothetical protein